MTAIESLLLSLSSPYLSPLSLYIHTHTHSRIRARQKRTRAHAALDFKITRREEKDTSTFVTSAVKYLSLSGLEGHLHKTRRLRTHVSRTSDNASYRLRFFHFQSYISDHSARFFSENLLYKEALIRPIFRDRASRWFIAEWTRN